MSDIHERILDRITAQKISYGELSKLTGIPKSVLQRYATGETKKIPVDSLKVIASALNTTAAYLMGWEEAQADMTATGLTLDDLADEIGVSPAQLEALIGGSSPEVIGKLSKAANLLTDDATRKKLGITDHEWDLILQYRKASDKDKAVVDTVLGLK